MLSASRAAFWSSSGYGSVTIYGRMSASDSHLTPSGIAGTHETRFFHD